MQFFKRKKAFTLIEILVVVSIIGILASVVTVNLIYAQKKSRNTKRIGDLEAMNNAIKQYYATENNLPDNRASSGACIVGSSYGGGVCLGELISNYMAVLPTDPLNQPGNKYSYHNYGTYVTIFASLEPQQYGPFPYGWNCSGDNSSGGWWAGMECDSIGDSTERKICTDALMDNNPTTTYTPPEGITLNVPGDTKKYCNGFKL
ncbi:MAG: type II secretion system protein [Patescibacteria group bacterium]